MWCGLLMLLAYLLGSIPTGYTAAKLLKGIDIRDEGSGSIGATNVLRTLGKGPAVVVLLVDTLKGVGAIALASAFYAVIPPDSLPLDWQPWLAAAAGIMAILGHSRSIWLNFAGGKSVATSLGVLLAMSLPVGLSALVIFLAVLGISRIVSLSSMTAAVAVAVLSFIFPQPLPYDLFGLAAGIYVIWRHRSNIERLLSGTEPQIGQKLPTQTVSE
ncbi:glycerol-3-phosphate 1-O-acyltransferase PlsY [Merismopedia glauca]|nr:glycerol-3-phosphate 1-O-acyltransferase PlsY [Merismopedia glauca]